MKSAVFFPTYSDSTKTLAGGNFYLIHPHSLFCGQNDHVAMFILHLHLLFSISQYN